MKKQSSLKLLALSLGLTVAGITQSTNASLLSYDGFGAGYTVPAELPSSGSPAVTGYTGAWTDVDFGDQEPGTLAGSLDYTDALYLAETGDKVGVPTNTTGGEITAANSGRVFRLLDSSLTVTNSTADTLYLSFLFQSGQETGATTYQMLSLYNTDTADANRNFDAGLTNNGGQTGLAYNFGADNAYSSTGVAANTAVHLFVVKFTLSATALSDSLTVWLDPTLGAGDPSGGTTVSGVDLTWDRLAFSDYEGNSANWDEVRWGTTFDDVTVVPEPGTFAMLLGGMGLLTLFRRRRA